MTLIGRDRVDKAIVNLAQSANDDLRGIYLAGLTQIIQGTPVDKGRARNNWFLTVRAPSTQTTTSNSSGLGSIRQLKKMPLNITGKKIYFTNNLPYITKIEYGGFTTKPETEKTIDGFSKQAPEGMVRKALIAMRNKIRKL